MTDWGRTNNGPEVHHLSPNSAQSHTLIVELVDAKMWDQDSAIYNTIALPTDPNVAATSGVATHRTSHPHYTTWYKDQLTIIARDNAGDLDAAKREVIGLNNYLKGLLLDPDRTAGLRNSDMGTANYWSSIKLETIRETDLYKMGNSGVALRVLANQADEGTFASDDPYNGISNMSAAERRDKLGDTLAADAARILGVSTRQLVDDVTLQAQSEALREWRLGNASDSDVRNFLSGATDHLKVGGRTILGATTAFLLISATAEAADAKGSAALDVASLTLIAYGLKQQGVLDDVSLSGLVSLIKNSNIAGLIADNLDNLVSGAAVDAALAIAASALGVGLLWNGVQILQSLSLLDTAIAFAADPDGDGVNSDDALGSLADKVDAVKAFFGFGANADVSDVDPSTVQQKSVEQMQEFIYETFSDEELDLIALELFKARKSNNVGLYGVRVQPTLDEMLEDLAGSNVNGDTLQEKLKNVFDLRQMEENPALYALFNPDECFAAGTMVAMWDGGEKPIEDICAGDTVLSFASDGTPQPGTVSRLFRNVTTQWLSLDLSDAAAPLIVTPGHRFLTETGDYVEIGTMMQLGARLVLQDGTARAANATPIAYSTMTAPLFEAAQRAAVGGTSGTHSAGWQTYNFEVAGHHNYVAGGVRVHNDSVLSLLTDEERANIVRIDPDANGDPIFAVSRIVRGNVEIEKTVYEQAGSTLAGTVETTVSDGLGTVYYGRELRDGDGRVTTQYALQPLQGQFQGEAVGKALTPFLTQAIIGDDASVFEQIAADTFLGTIMENFGGVVGALIHRGQLDVGDMDFSEQFETISKGVFEDFGQELVINGVNATVGVVNQLIMAEIFGDAGADNVGDAVVQAFANATVNNFLSMGAHHLLTSDFFTNVFVDLKFGEAQIGQITGAFAPTNFISPDFIGPSLPGSQTVLVAGTEGVANIIGVDPISLIISTVINHILPPLETLEGNIASVITGALLASWSAFTGALGWAAGPVGAVISFFVGKIFDALFDKDPQAWSKVGFNEDTGLFEITGTWSDDGGNTALSQSMAQAYVDAMNAFVTSVMAQSHNYDELGQWSFGHYEEALKNAGRSGKTFAEFQDAYLNAYVDDMTEVQVNDGQMVAVRAVEQLDVATLREDHRLKMFLEWLETTGDIYTGSTFAQVTIGWGEDRRTVTQETPNYAETFREKLEYFATDGTQLIYYSNVGYGENEWMNTWLAQQNGPYARLGAQMQLALEEMTQNPRLLELLSMGDFVTYADFVDEIGLPQHTLDDEGIYTRIASTLQIASDYHKYMENQEEVDALIAAAPSSALAAGWLQTLQYVSMLGLDDAFDLNGDSVDNVFYLGEGDDRVNGLGGDDLIKGYAGDDTLYGANGNDTLDGGSGDNLLKGNGGNDTYQVSALSGDTRIRESAGQGDDTVLFDVRFNTVELTFDADADGFVATWDGGSVDATNIETVAFQFTENAQGESQLIEVALSDIRQGGTGGNSVGGSGRSDYLALGDANPGQTGFRVLQGNGGDDLYVYRQDMGNVSVLGETASRGAADRLVLQDVSYSEVDLSVQTTGGQDYLRLQWEDEDTGHTGEVRLSSFGSHIEAIQFADNAVLDGVFFSNGDTQALNHATGRALLDAYDGLERMLAYIDGLASHQMIIGHTPPVLTSVGWGEDRTWRYVSEPIYAETLAEKMEFLSTFSGALSSVTTTGWGEDRQTSTFNLFNTPVSNLPSDLQQALQDWIPSDLLGHLAQQGGFATLAQFRNAVFEPVDAGAGLGVFGTMGHDYVHVTGTSNTVVTLDGADTVIAGSGADHIDTGAGNDSIRAGSSWDTIHAGDGDDTVDGGNGRDEVWLGDGMDVYVDNAQNDSNGADLVYGQGGDDTLTGRGGRDTLEGGAGFDLLIGGTNNDRLVGGGDNDTLVGGMGADALVGGTGWDIASYDTADSGVVAMLAAAGSNTGDAAGDTFSSIEGLIGSDFRDTLYGNATTNQIWGNDGNDTIRGGDVNDTVYAGAGEDSGWQYLHGGAGDDWLVIHADSGRVGTHNLDYSEAEDPAPQPVQVGFGEHSYWMTPTLVPSQDTVEFADISINDFSFTTTSRTGTAWNETLILSWDVEGETGSYWVADEGAHIESFRFADGTELSAISVDHWSYGRDKLTATNGDDFVGSPDGTDWAYVYGLDGDDSLFGGDGRDYLFGGNGDDTLSAGGNDRDNGWQALYGQNGSDTYRIRSTDENVLLTHTADAERAGEVDRVEFTDLALSDVWFTVTDYTQGGTVSHVYGEALNIHWEGGQLRVANMGEDIEEFAFSDGSTFARILPHKNRDDFHRYYGDDDDNAFFGSDVADQFYAGDGDDTLDAGGSNGTWQYLYGQGGSDSYRYGTESRWVFITTEGVNADDVDTVTFKDLNIEDVSLLTYDYTQGGTVNSASGVALRFRWTEDGTTGELRVAQMGERIEKFIFSDGTTLGSFDLANPDHLHGTQDGDLIRGVSTGGEQFGYGGDDTLRGSEAADRMVGGTGNDLYTVNHTGDSIVETSGQGYDAVYASITYQLRTHSQHTDSLTLIGEDNINGTGNGQNNVVTGNSGDNLLNGAGGHDTLIGGDGNDRFRDDVGNEVMQGGAGADIFIFAGSFGRDEIVDFQTGQTGEVIDLSGVSAITSYSDLVNNHLSGSGNTSVITVNASTSITLTGVSVGSLSADDFVF